jgi:protoporphyrinogen oxidase
MILILGGGLAGLSTAFHLRELPHLVLEAEATAGGLCRSRDIDGFTFDYTGHLLHLRDSRAVALVNELLPEQWNVIERRAVVRTHGVNLPFPFQANLHGLPSRVVADYLIDFIKALSRHTWWTRRRSKLGDRGIRRG